MSYGTPRVFPEIGRGARNVELAFTFYLTMPTRPTLDALPSASSSSIALHHAQSSRLFPLFAQLSFHVIPAKLDGELSNVYSWIEELGGRCVSVESGRYVVTALKGRMRIERILSREYIVSRPAA